MKYQPGPAPIILEAIGADLSRFWIAFGIITAAQLVLVIEYFAVFPVLPLLLSIIGLTESHSIQGNLSRAWLAGFHLFFIVASVLSAVYTFGAPRAQGAALIRSKAPNNRWLRGWVYRLLAGGLTVGVFTGFIDWYFCRIEICMSNWNGMYGTLVFYLTATGLWIAAVVALVRLPFRLAKRRRRARERGAAGGLISHQEFGGTTKDSDGH